jgi:ubiquinone/menaquinone biosynthesis C-methylase UbiE
MQKGSKEYHKIDEIIGFYRDSDTVSQYEKTRFQSPVRHNIHNSEIEILKEHIPKDNPRILDMPVGTGRLARNIGITGVGMDASSEMIRSTSEKLKDWDLTLGNAYSLPFKDNYFDCVYSFAFIGHFDKDNRKRLYKEIGRILKDQGIFIFDVVYKESKFIEYIHEKVRTQYGDEWVYYATFDKEEIIGEIETNGFRIMKIYTYPRMFVFKTLEEFVNFFVKKPSSNSLFKSFLYKIEGESYYRAKRPYKLVIVCQK